MNSNQQASHETTPGSIFANTLATQSPQAMAWVTGGASYPQISGLVKFFSTPYGGVLIEAEIFNLPNIERQGSSDFYAFHIHEYGDCSDDFAHTGEHYNPDSLPHPDHAGDLPPLLSNQGYAWLTFYDKRFFIEDIIGKSVVIHSGTDDFRSQPSGDSKNKIACGVIRVVGGM